MQIELLLGPTTVASPVLTDLLETSSEMVRTMSAALISMRRATGPSQHAVAVDTALNAVMPAVTEIGAHFAARWPAANVDADALVEEALLELTAALAFAPRGDDRRLAAWLSNTVFDALHFLWLQARDAEAHPQATYAARSAVSDVSSREDVSHDLLVASETSTPDTAACSHSAWTSGGDRYPITARSDEPPPLRRISSLLLSRLGIGHARPRARTFPTDTAPL